MPLFSRFKNKGAQPASKEKSSADRINGHLAAPSKPRWVSNWNSKTIEVEEVEELIHACTTEMKSRAEALDAPFLLLPFRLDSDPLGARTFIRNFFKANQEGSNQYRGSNLSQELRLTEAIVLCSILKWCWSRIPGGVVTWPVYDGFQIGEKEANYARNAFETFIPIISDSQARKSIIFDFYDLMAAVAAHGKMNGLGGRKLSRLAGWWAFEHTDDGKGFEGGYRSWTAAADASTHLFFAYLRTLSPEEHPSMSLIERIPRSLQSLLASTEYPPETPTLLQRSTPRVVMMVDAVSPTPFTLLRRAKHFEYRDNDRVLRHYSEFEDPVLALTEECKRVLSAISNTGASAAKSRHGNAAKRDESWSAFQNTGFADLDEKALQNGSSGGGSAAGKSSRQGLRSEPRSRDHARPTTPSWADFMSSGFAEDEESTPSTTLLLPSDNVLPPLGSRSRLDVPEEDGDVAPGELAAIANVDLDETFWWVWLTSLAPEEPAERKAVFGRCAVIETIIMNGKWLIMEEQLKGASPSPDESMYIAKKKGSIFSFTKRGKLSRKRSTNKVPLPTPPQIPVDPMASPTPSRRSLAPDQQSKIKSAALALKRQDTKEDDSSTRRGRYEDDQSKKTNSVLTIGLQSEAGPAMKWANSYDKNAVRAQYLGDRFAGTGRSREDLSMMPSPSVNGFGYESSVASPAPQVSPERSYFPTTSDDTRELPALPKEESAFITPAETPLEPQAPPPPAPAPVPAAEPEVNHPTYDDAEDEYSPEPTPILGSNALEKELSVGTPTSPHPAYRQNGFSEPGPAPRTPTQQIPAQQSPKPHAAIMAAQRAMTSSSTSPESNKDIRVDPRKPPPSSGLKKLFGRKKDEGRSRQSMDGARAASNSLAPPVESNPTRKLSFLRKKPIVSATPQVTGTENAQRGAAELDGSQLTPNSYGSIQNSNASTSQIGAEDHKEAEQEFARFDQGPVDMPAPPPAAATPPQTSTPSLIAPQPQRKAQLNTQLAAQIAPQNEGDSLVQYGVDDDTQSEATMEDAPAPPLEETITESKDRWAIIRENAARRAAARASEEQSAQSRPSRSVRTDDGETSGEETIESRVARIKARVAELTGGMDNGAPRR